MSRTRTSLALQSLEDRFTPATFTAVRTTSTLVITQTTAAAGQISITDNPALGTVTADDLGDGLPAMVFPTAGRPNLAVSLRPADATAADYTLTSDRAGSVSVSVKNVAARTLSLSVGSAIGGNLTVTGGNGGLTVNETGGGLHVTGNATFRGGVGFDTVNLTGVNGSSVGGTLTAQKVNNLSTKFGDSVGRLVFNAAGEATPNSVSLLDTHVLGSITYVGGTRSDVLDIDSEMGANRRVEGDVRVSFGSQSESDVSQLGQGSTYSIGGKVTVTGSSLGTESVVLRGSVDGAIAINLAGGANTVTLTGRFNSPTIAYVGGIGVDTVTYDSRLSGTRARFSARLGAGADTVTLETRGTAPASVFIDFGAGLDTFNVGFNPTIDFPCQFLNLP